MEQKKYAILEDVFEFSKIKAKKTTLTTALANRCEVYEDVLWTFDNLADARNYILTMTAECVDMGGYWRISQFRLAEWADGDYYDNGGCWSLDSIATQALTTAPTDYYGRPLFYI